MLAVQVEKSPLLPLLKLASKSSALRDFREEDGLFVYQLVYQRNLETALTQDQDNVFTVNSFSRYFGMTGWRNNIFLAAPTTAQYGALAAFQPDSLKILEEKRAGIHCIRP